MQVLYSIYEALNMGLNDFEEKIEKESLVEAALRKARRIRRENQVSLGEFCNIYPEDEIEADSGEVRRLKSVFQEGMGENQYYGEIWEGIIIEGGELSNWFGEGAFVCPSSDYDDIKNGVDSIVVFQDSDGENTNSYLALAVDVTIASSVGKKLERIREEVVGGKLTSVKYFYSPDTGERGTLSHVPRTVIAVSSHFVEEVMELWVEESKENKRKLAEHIFQDIMVEQIRIQLQAAVKLAEKMAENNSSYSSQVDRCLKKGFAHY